MRLTREKHVCFLFVCLFLNQLMWGIFPGWLHCEGLDLVVLLTFRGCSLWRLEAHKIILKNKGRLCVHFRAPRATGLFKLKKKKLISDVTGGAGKAGSESYTRLLSNVTITKTDQKQENPGTVKSLCRAEKARAADPVAPLAHRFGMNTSRYSHFPKQDVSCSMLVSANENHTARGWAAASSSSRRSHCRFRCHLGEEAGAESEIVNFMPALTLKEAKTLWSTQGGLLGLNFVQLDRKRQQHLTF